MNTSIVTIFPSKRVPQGQQKFPKMLLDPRCFVSETFCTEEVNQSRGHPRLSFASNGSTPVGSGLKQQNFVDYEHHYQNKRDFYLDVDTIFNWNE